MESVQARFAYKGNGDENLIDEVLFFEYFDNALEMERTLHSYFADRALFPGKGEPDMPLAANGQSELYSEDVLVLDPSYLITNHRKVQEEILRFRLRKADLPKVAIEAEIERRFAPKHKPEPPPRWTIHYVWYVFTKWFYSPSFEYAKPTRKPSRSEEAGKRLVREIRTSVHGPLDSDDENALRGIIRRKRLGILKKKFREDDLRELYTEQKLLREALAAFVRRDFEAFETMVDMDAFARNLADAMTADFFMGSDYMGVANNCCLVNMMDAMEEDSPRDVLLRPVEETYKALLRHLVKTHTLLTEDLIQPPDPIYESDLPGGGFKRLSENYFGPRQYLDLLGRDWNLPAIPSFTKGDGWVEFPVKVSNRTNGFEGALLIRARRSSDEKQVILGFPNLQELEKKAYEHSRTSAK